MRRSRSSNSSSSSRSGGRNSMFLNAKGLNKLTALLMLFPLSIVEFGLVVYMIAFGFRALPLPLFIFSLINLGFCVALTMHIFTHKQVQAGGYMEVSNYSNLNKLGRDKF